MPLPRHRSLNIVEFVLFTLLLLLIAGMLSTIGVAGTANSLSQPNQVGYQAILNGSDGLPVPDGFHTIVFRLVSDSVGGDTLWEESRSVSTIDGFFSLYLGEIVPLSDTVLEVASHLQITVNGEVLDPLTRMAAAPSSYFAGTARSLRGEVVTENGSLFLPGNNPMLVPKAVEIAKTDSGGQLGIWGSAGTAFPQVELRSLSTGGFARFDGVDGESLERLEIEAGNGSGRLGIWGSAGTAFPQVELRSLSTGGFARFDGVDGESLERVEIEAGNGSGRLGIWGTNGTAYSQVLLGTSPDGGFAMFKGIDGDGLERVEVEAGDGAGSIGIWGTNGTALPRLNLYGDLAGGTLVLRDTGDIASIFLDGASTGDASVRVPSGSINADELSNEPGLVQDRVPSCVAIATTSMQDLAVVTITTPADGYIFLTGSGMVEFSGTTLLNRIDIQIDQTSGGGSTNGYFSRIGLDSYGSTSFSSFNFSVNRTYFMTAGEHTFRLEARRLAVNGIADVCWPVLTAMYLPTSYGTVTTISAKESGDTTTENGSMATRNGTGSTANTLDLRQLEIRAKNAHIQALKADLELINARKRVGNR